MTADREPQTEAGRRLAAHLGQSVGPVDDPRLNRLRAQAIENAGSRAFVGTARARAWLELADALESARPGAIVVQSPNYDEDILAIEAEAASRHEALLREQGWADPYEVETAAAMNHGAGLAEARADAAREAEATCDGSCHRDGCQYGCDATCHGSGHSAAREAQPDPRVEALRETAQKYLDLTPPYTWSMTNRNHEYDREDAYRALRAALAAPAPPPAGIDVALLIRVMNTAHREHATWAIAECAEPDCKAMLALTRARLAPQPTADAESPHDIAKKHGREM